MEEKLGIITKKDLLVLSKQAFESAKNKGLLPWHWYYISPDVHYRRNERSAAS